MPCRFRCTNHLVDFGEDVFVYVSEEALRLFASRWADSYLRKLEEASNILRYPLYAAYDEKPADQPDEWGDLDSWRRAASAS